MANFDDIESAREFFYKDKFAVDTGITLDELSEDHAICSLKLTDNHRNAYGGVMGGVIFTLADFAVDIHYLSAPKGEKLIAHATCRKDGRTSSIVNVDISDDTGRDVAQFIGTGFKL